MPSRKEIDLEQVEGMASEFCTQEEIAEDMGFDRTLFMRRQDVRAAFIRGKNAAKMSLRHMMWLQAKQGDRTMQIFLAKNELGYRDNPNRDEADPHALEGANEQIHSIADLINAPRPNRPIGE